MMILRRITEHVKAQNWFAVGIDFIIVVVGVFVGLQVQQWAVERDRQKSERYYLARLHGEVEQLIEVRSGYNSHRKIRSTDLIEAVRILEEENAGAMLSVEHCNAIAGSAHTTVPPADLPTVTELLSAGRLDQLTSSNVRASIVFFVQDAARAKDLIAVISASSRDLGKTYPQLIAHHIGPSPYNVDSIWLNPECNTMAMREDQAFKNELSENAYAHSVYTERAVLPVSRHLAELHVVLDTEIGINHATLEEISP